MKTRESHIWNPKETTKIIEKYIYFVCFPQALFRLRVTLQKKLLYKQYYSKTTTNMQNFYNLFQTKETTLAIQQTLERAIIFSQAKHH